MRHFHTDRLQHGGEPGVPCLVETWLQRTMFLQTHDDILQQTGRQLNKQRDGHSNKQRDSFYITGVFNRPFKTFISHNCSCPSLFSPVLHLLLSYSLLLLLLSSLLCSFSWFILPPGCICFSTACFCLNFTRTINLFSFFFSSSSPEIRATSGLRSVTS